jgi:hypothetical protein
MIKSILLFAFFLLFTFSSDRVPMKAKFSNSASYRWLNKEVLKHRVLDEMENLDNWVSFTQGAQQVVDARVDVRVTEANKKVTGMTITNEKAYSGNHSLRMVVPTKLDVPGPKSGRGWGTAGVRREFSGEDWSNMNRISLWIYPECPGFYVNWLELRISNDGVDKLPALFGQEGETSLLLRNNEWNHVVWEIGNVARDKVTSFEISYYMGGNEPEATDTAIYYFDHLELQKVDPDHIEGWNVWPGRISYSHTGYQSGASKTALASGLSAKNFRIINEQTGETVLSKPIQKVENQLGIFQEMDFTEIRAPGNYIIDVEGLRSQPFPINNNVWRNTILKALNFFYMERCGVEIPGVHSACHRDWTCVHGDKKIVINGGWHDAGDLTQGLGNTAEAIYVMFSLAEYLHSRNDDPELYDRLMEEARWGLDWILKTSFRDGYRNGGSISSRRTNGIIGDNDDNISTARNSPMDHFVASAAEAIGYRLMKRAYPRKAALSLEMAEEDFQFAVEGMEIADETSNKNVFRGTFDSDNVEHLAPSVGILTAVDLWKATGDNRYIEYATEWAKVIINSQQRTFPDWEVPLAGFFYTSPKKEHIMHYCHHGREHSPILALTQLCETFTDHPDWMDWYSAVTLHAQYLKKIARYTQPYGVLPASVYSDGEYLLAPESRQESFKEQVLNGIPLGKGHYLRIFPVWMDYRGHFGTILPQGKALASSGFLRGDLESLQIAQKQLEWVIGRNPFSQSNMWGEGYDFPPLYSVFSGDMVGGLPVGIQTREAEDVPYWPVQNSWTYKEIWSFPAISWISLMRNVSGPAMVIGIAETEVEFVDDITGQVIRVSPGRLDGTFKVTLPQGQYTVRCGDMEFIKIFLPASDYQLDLRKEKALDFEIVQTTSSKGEVTLELTAHGIGKHNFTMRTNNITLKKTNQEVDFKQGNTITLEWKGQIVKKDMPWLAVILPDDNFSLRKEVMGSTFPN